MSFVHCEFYKGYYYFIVYWAFDFINLIGKEYFESIYNYNINNNNTNKTNNTISSNNNDSEYVNNGVEFDLLNLLFLIIPDLSFGFLVAYTNIKMNCIKENKEENPKDIPKNNYKLIYNDPSKVKNKYILILLISILDFIGRSGELFFFLLIVQERLKIFKLCWLVSIDIFSRIIFCRFILKTKLYKHHWLSVAFCSVGFLINGIYCFITINTLNNWLYLFFAFISKVLYALEDTINKILLNDKLLLPHFLLFWRGIYTFIIFLILTVILYFTSNIQIEYYENLLSNIDFLRVIIQIIFIIFNFIKIFCIFKIIYIFTPQHVGFCNVAIYFSMLIEFFIKSEYLRNDILHFILDIISLIFIFIGTIIFNEIIILNFWGLNENTKSGKIKKETLDNMDFDATIDFNENEIDNEDKNGHSDEKEN